VLHGDVIEEVTKLKQRYERDIVVHGSPQLEATRLDDVYPMSVAAVQKHVRCWSGPASSRRSAVDGSSRVAASASASAARSGWLKCGDSPGGHAPDGLIRLAGLAQLGLSAQGVSPVA
jgi:hypothetical protein